MRRAALPFLACAVLAGVLTGCGGEAPEPGPVETNVPESLRVNLPAATPAPAEEAAIGTPLQERVATIGLLNKRNNVSQDLEMSPGETRRVGPVVIRLQSCERTAPWEMPQETGAFVQVMIQESNSDEFRRVFSGWLFKNSPSLNVVEHPIYDVWVKDCAMDFPGEEAEA
ncbi:MAG: DUF2155 domain-containing protein [Erythrobacter sp.]|nr:DUF2155 domain-containing protein [Erythrobacter sp.]